MKFVQIGGLGAFTLGQHAVDSGRWLLSADEFHRVLPSGLAGIHMLVVNTMPHPSQLNVVPGDAVFGTVQCLFNQLFHEGRIVSQ